MLSSYLIIAALQFLRKMEDVSADLEEMETESSENTEETYTMKMLLMAKELRLPLLIAVTLQVAQQLSGINAVRTERGRTSFI